MTTQKQIRAAFWQQWAGFRAPALPVNRKRDDCDTRCAFVDFVDALARNGEITEALAQRATL